LLALRLADEEEIPWISAGEVVNLNPSPDHGVTYLVDVRSESEYESGHISGSLNIPGGQAVQRADDFVAVKNGKIIFISGESTRAVMAAYWYRQMGFRNVSVLQGGLRAWTETGFSLLPGVPSAEPLGFEAARKAAKWITPIELDRRLKDSSLLVLDVGTSNDFEAAHIPGARWISRGWIEVKLPEEFPDRSQPVIDLTAKIRCPLLRRLRSRLHRRPVRRRHEAWTAAGYRTGKRPDSVSGPNDVVLHRPLGDREDMKRYLDWEVNPIGCDDKAHAQKRRFSSCRTWGWRFC
jgi:rhodanese-related sulfurtransferase